MNQVLTTTLELLMTVTVGQAFEALGYVLHEDETVAIGDNSSNSMVTRSLHDVADEPIGINRYFSTGTFPRDTDWTVKNARSGEKVKRLLCLPFDFDLQDFLNTEKVELIDLDNDELDGYKRLLQASISDMFKKLGLPIHRLDDTGYGLAVQVRIPDGDQQDISLIRTLHKSTIARINKIFNATLADVKVSDPGSRYIRLIPCQNVYFDKKTGIISNPRQSKNLVHVPGVIDSAMLTAAAGPQRVWKGRPTSFIGKDLPTSLEQEIVSLLAPFWAPGSKHDLGLSVGGWWVKSDISEETAVRMGEALAANDNKPWDRVKSIRDSYHRYREGLEVKGITGLKGVVDEDVLDHLSKRLRAVKNASAGKLSISSKATSGDTPTAKVERFSQIPESARRGFIGRYIDLMHPTTEAPDSFHMGVGLTTAGATLGRDIWCEYGEPTFANLFTLLIGRSGKTRKDTAIRRGTRFISDQHIINGKLMHQITRIITDIGSAEGLMTELSSHSNLLLYSTEFSKLMGNAKRKATGTIIPTLMQAWDAPITMSTLTRGDPIEAHFPYLNVLAATQPEILANLMSEDDVFSGFANRWFFICGEPTSIPISSPPPVDHLISRELYDELRHRRDEGSARRYGFVLSKEALIRWNDWYNQDFRRDSDTPEEDAMRPRHAPLIRKIALIYAATEGTKDITLDQINASIDIIEWMWSNIGNLVPTWGQGDYAKLERRILDLLAQAPNQTMRRRDLQRKCQNRTWTSIDFGRTVDALEASDRIRSDVHKNIQLITDEEDEHVRSAD